MTGIQTLSGSKDHEMFNSLSDAVRFIYHSGDTTVTKPGLWSGLWTGPWTGPWTGLWNQ